MNKNVGKPWKCEYTVLDWGCTNIKFWNCNMKSYDCYFWYRAITEIQNDVDKYLIPALNGN